MTVLTKLIKTLRGSKDQHTKDKVLLPSEIRLFEEVVKMLESYLPAEEQQIRDAHVSGRLYEQGKHQSYDNPQPDLETYITDLKAK